MRGYVREGFDPRELQGRLLLLMVLVILFGIFVGLRLWNFQIIRGNTEITLDNAMRASEIAASRGLILSADGERLAAGAVAWDLLLTPSDVPREVDESGWDAQPDIWTLAHRLDPLVRGLAAWHVLQVWSDTPGMRRNLPQQLSRDLVWDEAATIRARLWGLDGIEVRARPRRDYPESRLFAHVVGYLRELRPDQLKELQLRYHDREDDWYQLGDLWGTYGLEKVWEERLKGYDGMEYSLRDVAGRRIQGDTPLAQELLAEVERRRVLPIPGSTLETTLRLDLQHRARELMGEETGAVVVVEAQTGRILVYLSQPSFDPTIFASTLPKSTWEALRDDPSHPLVDKVAAGIYPPGSTYKPFVAAAALQQGLSPSYTVHCNGFVRMGNEVKRCWKFRSGGHGKVDLYRAIVESCDSWFYKVGLELGMDTLSEELRYFGFGQRTGVRSNMESHGILPTPSWAREKRNEVWQNGDTASAVIGQGYSLSTPLQLAVATAALANGGTVYRPQLRERIVDPRTGQVLERFAPEVVGHLNVSPEILDEVRQAMVGVVADSRGTARRQFLRDLPYGGKTGTAQVVRQTVEDLAAGRPEKQFRDHALFIAFAPAENPQIAIAVIVEHGEHGSSAAAPIARGLIETWRDARKDSSAPEEDL